LSSFVFANNCSTSLAGPVGTLDTVIRVASAANLPTIGVGEVWAITLNDAATQTNFEICYVTSISGANLTVIRGREGTSAQSWLTGDFAYAADTAGILASFVQGGGGNFVELSPGSAQTGFIDITGAVTADSAALANDATAKDFIASRTYGATPASSLALRLLGSSLIGVGPSNSLVLDSIVASALGIGIAGGATLLTLDVDGNLSIPGNLHSASIFGSAKIYNADGTLLSDSPKIVQGSVYFPAHSTSETVTLSGAAIFTGIGTYLVFVQPYQASLPSGPVSYFITNNSGSQFTVICGSIGSDINLAWFAIGY
jgi:hypothetical protein